MGRRPARSPTRRRVIGTIDCIIEIQQVFLSAEYKAEQTFFIFPARPGIFLIRYLLYLLLLFAFTHESFTSPLLKRALPPRDHSSQSGSAFCITYYFSLWDNPCLVSFSRKTALSPGFFPSHYNHACNRACRCDKDHCPEDDRCAVSSLNSVS